MYGTARRWREIRILEGFGFGRSKLLICNVESGSDVPDVVGLGAESGGGNVPDVVGASAESGGGCQAISTRYPRQKTAVTVGTVAS